jgi:uncharacterized protein Yka (UPF0111/DUF47 family)
MLRSIIPRDEEFFTMFDELTGHIVDGAALLQEMMGDGDHVPELASRLHDCEHRGDETVHRALHHLHRTFVTPLDRLDIHLLVTRLDDILDLTNAAGSRLDLYHPKTVRAEGRELSATLLASTQLVQELISLLRNLKKQKERIMALAVEVNTRENEADRQRREAVARLLEEERDPFEFIKWKEIFDLMEQATDCCEDVADTIEGIVLAHG